MDIEKEDAYSRYINQKPICPVCGGIMEYDGGLLPWTCPDCGQEADLEYDEVNKEYYVKLPREYTLDEIYADPIANMPECCVACGGPYPRCLISCSIFDN